MQPHQKKACEERGQRYQVKRGPERVVIGGLGSRGRDSRRQLKISLAVENSSHLIIKRLTDEASELGGLGRSAAVS
jgi:hypothetical protein